jgi:hypothetical protein
LSKIKSCKKLIFCPLGEKRYKRFCSVAPFDVQCHGHCPYDENEWNSSRIKWNCSNKRVGATYHCTDPDDESGNPIEACGVPTSCDKGRLLFTTCTNVKHLLQSCMG